MAYYEGYVDAIIRLFPELHLDRTKFSTSGRTYNEPEQRRQFLEDIAEEMRFDPLVAKHWYNVTYRDLREKQACRSFAQLLTKIE